MTTPAIRVWTNSSVENMAASPLPACGERACPGLDPGSTREARRVRGPPRKTRTHRSPLTPTLSPQAGRGSSSLPGARVLDDDGCLFPVLVRRGVLQDQHRRRPVVEEHALGAREGHRCRGPALETAGLERP